MARDLKSTSDQIDWRKVDLFSRSLPEGVDNKQVSLTTGTVKIEVHFCLFLKEFHYNLLIVIQNFQFVRYENSSHLLK